MSKALKWIIGIVIVLALLGFGGFQFLKMQTKKHSPQELVELSKGALNVEVAYSRPFKKEREIFGGLVPFNEVWRTGANEATTFNSNKDLTIGSNTLPAGKYTLWTIPNKDNWTVIFNSKQYPWGVKFSDGKASRDPEADVLTVKVPVEQLPSVVEQFTIAFEESPQMALTMAWDQTGVSVPME